MESETERLMRRIERNVRHTVSGDKRFQRVKATPRARSSASGNLAGALATAHSLHGGEKCGKFRENTGRHGNKHGQEHLPMPPKSGWSNITEESALIRSDQFAFGEDVAFHLGI
jgi:hypothetical protein